MASKDGEAKCGQFWCLIDEGSRKAFASWACFSWRCDVCGPKRRAEAMDMLRMRIEWWQDDPHSLPNFITLTCDPSQLPDEIEKGTDEEDGYLRKCFGNVMRQLNQKERRAGRSRIQYVGVVERGEKSGNWHLHLVTDRQIHVDEWRRVCVAHGLGRVVKGKKLDGARGAAVYLAKYLQKGKTRLGKRGRRVLLHTRGCLPSLELWRWRRARGTPYPNASSWTKESLKLQREQMEADKARRRLEMEVESDGEIVLRGSARLVDGGRRTMVSQRLQRKYASRLRRPQLHRSSCRRREQLELVEPSEEEAE